jgi:hypothetical protein
MILPAVLAFVMQSHWPWKVKANVAWVACFLTAIGVALAQGLLTGMDATSAQVIAVKFGVILTLCTQLYDKFYKPTGIAPKIENATDVTPAPPTASLPDPQPTASVPTPVMQPGLVIEDDTDFDGPQDVPNPAKA